VKHFDVAHDVRVELFEFLGRNPILLKRLAACLMRLMSIEITLQYPEAKHVWQPIFYPVLTEDYAARIASSLGGNRFHPELRIKSSSA
jgi:hypothetical protein